MALKQINKQTALFGRAGTLGFAGVGIICVTQMLALQQLDSSLKFAVLCFCFAIPLLCASGLMHEAFLEHDKIEEEWHRLALAPGAIGCLIGVFSVAGIFWHFSWIYGILFLIAVTVVTSLSVNF